MEARLIRARYTRPMITFELHVASFTRYTAGIFLKTFSINNSFFLFTPHLPSFTMIYFVIFIETNCLQLFINICSLSLYRPPADELL